MNLENNKTYFKEWKLSEAVSRQNEKLEKLIINKICIFNDETMNMAASSLLEIVSHNSEDDIKNDLEEAEENGVPSNLKIMRDILGYILYRGSDGKCYPFTIYIEPNHVEKFYRDSYYSHISSKHFIHSRYCKRLYFVSGKYEKNFLDISEEELNENFLGICVIRPSADERGSIIGRTLLKPQLFRIGDSPRLCTAEFVVHAFSKELKIQAFPYMMQDGETITCAETTILLLMEFFGNKYPEYHSIVPSDIYGIVQKNSYKRATPSSGMTCTAISKVLTELGFFPVLYGNEKCDRPPKLKKIMHYYVDSEIPVAINLNQKGSRSNKHSVVCIGFGKKYDIDDKRLAEAVQKVNDSLYVVDSADLYDDYTIMNDSSHPYANMRFFKSYKDKRVRDSISSNNVQDFDIFDNSLCITQICANFDMSTMVVPLSKRMFMEAMDVVDIARQILSHEKISFTKMIENIEFENQEIKELIPKATVGDPLIYRVFLSTSSVFKRMRANAYEGNELLKNIYSTTPMPKFVWVFELYGKNHLKFKKRLERSLLTQHLTAKAHIIV